MNPTPAYSSRGFTLLEMIVVVLIIALLAAMTVPRLTSNQPREFNLAVEKVADLLTMYAQRENLSSKVVGISHDYERNALQLQIIDTDNNAPDQGAHWRADFFTPAVKLPAFMQPSDIEIFADGERYDASEWPLANELGETRPRIDIVMRGPDHSATITLTPYSVAPVVVNGGMVTGTARTQLDLDNSGMNREDW